MWQDVHGISLILGVVIRHLKLNVGALTWSSLRWFQLVAVWMKIFRKWLFVPEMVCCCEGQGHSEGSDLKKMTVCSINSLMFWRSGSQWGFRSVQILRKWLFVPEIVWCCEGQGHSEGSDLQKMTVCFRNGLLLWRPGSQWELRSSENDRLFQKWFAVVNVGSQWGFRSSENDCLFYIVRTAAFLAPKLCKSN